LNVITVGSRTRGEEKVKAFKYFMVLVLLLLCNLLHAQEKPYDYGNVWDNWSALHRYIYLSGFRDGMSEGWNDLERFFHKALQKDWSPYLEEHIGFYTKSISKNFPDLIKVRDVMTDLYAQPQNRYLEPRIVLLASVAKIKGASPELVEKLLVTAREKSSELYKMRGKSTITTEDVMRYIEGPSFSAMAYEEIYGEEE